MEPAPLLDNPSHGTKEADIRTQVGLEHMLDVNLPILEGPYIPRFVCLSLFLHTINFNFIYLRMMIMTVLTSLFFCITPPHHLDTATLSLKDRKSQCDSKGMLRVSIMNSLFAMKMMKEVKEHAKDEKDGEEHRKRRIVMKMALDAFTVLDTT